ncbi:uncharacterized protein AB675_2528 [Cyphellophora attinorum]|uniref:F-box domain-containing protein n=1 Tax=Cyphellophora attinorum TaxID=1664694 RepID=A0A0N1HAC8_9EURO|nr:uncharacterized protein AB675_2528 [Phialophora attinorum]KPI44813.1 hypothetical protein AB675_2528 [Phialophora attinorum]
MNNTSRLLSLPPELRGTILSHLFDQQKIYHQRTPSHRRLRCSQADKDDTRGILQVCRLLRIEATPVFYRKNVLVFRTSDDVVEYILDSGIIPCIKANITKLAIDLGDIKCSEHVKTSHLKAIAYATSNLPRLEWLETRIYARTDCEMYYRNFMLVNEQWKALKSVYEAGPNDYKLQVRSRSVLEKIAPLYSAHLECLRAQGMKMSLRNARYVYWKEKGSPPANAAGLKECHLLLNKGEAKECVLFGTGVTERMRLVGAMPIDDRTLLDCDAWKERWPARHLIPDANSSGG